MQLYYKFVKYAFLYSNQYQGLFLKKIFRNFSKSNVTKLLQYFFPPNAALETATGGVLLKKVFLEILPN